MINSKTIFSLFLTAIIFVCCKKDKPHIAAPAGISVTNISDTSATISWGKSSNATAYSVFVASDAAFDHLVGTNIPAAVQQTSVTLENQIGRAHV